MLPEENSPVARVRGIVPVNSQQLGIYDNPIDPFLQSSYRRPIVLWRPLNEGIAEISNSSKKSAWVITKAAAGAAFTITQLSVLPPTASWSPRRRRFPPQDRPILGEARNLPFPLAIDPEDLPLRSQRIGR